MTWLRWTCTSALLAIACFSPSDDDDGSSGDSTSAADAGATESVTTTMTSSVSATNPTTNDDDDDDDDDDGPTDATMSATDPDTSDGDTTATDTDEASTTDPGTSDTGSEPTPCNPVAGDCDADEYCEAPDCVTQGMCVPRPAMTSPTMAPACGCNDTSYWNVEHAHWLGATAFATDISGCGAATTACDDGGDCSADGSACVTDHGLGPASCTNDEFGRCWAIPANAGCDDAPLQPDVGFGSCASGPNTCDGTAMLLCDAMLEGDYFAICL